MGLCTGVKADSVAMHTFILNTLASTIVFVLKGTVQPKIKNKLSFTTLMSSSNMYDFSFLRYSEEW